MNAVLSLQAPLSAGPFLKISNDLSDVADVATARTNLGLVAGGAGDIWVEKAGDIMSGALTVQGTLTMASDLIHEGDADTKLSFTDDQAVITVGNEALLTLTESTQDVVKLGDGGDVDINFNDDGLFEGSTGNLGVGTVSPDAVRLHVVGGAGGADIIKVERTGFGFGSMNVNNSDPQFVFSDGGTQIWSFGQDTATDSFRVTDGTSIGAGSGANDYLIITSAGRVGLNTVTAPSTELDIGAGAMEFDEMTAPGAGAVNTARIYAVDNGAGKTQLAVIFNTGAVQILATQP